MKLSAVARSARRADSVRPQAVLLQRLFPGNAVRGYDATSSVAEQEFSGPGEGRQVSALAAADQTSAQSEMQINSVCGATRTRSAS
jgi:hypothetical protein